MWARRRSTSGGAGPTAGRPRRLCSAARKASTGLPPGPARGGTGGGREGAGVGDGAGRRGRGGQGEAGEKEGAPHGRSGVGAGRREEGDDTTGAAGAARGRTGNSRHWPSPGRRATIEGLASDPAHRR